MTEQQRQEWYAMLKARANTEGTYAVTGGMRLVELGDGWARGELQLEERHRNPMGIVHGGVYCTMMDQVAGTAACTRGSICRTVNCEVRFLAPAQGGHLTSHAEAVRMGRSIAVIRAWVEDTEGTVCAEGIYTFRLKPME
mgnify:FL=1